MWEDPSSHGCWCCSAVGFEDIHWGHAVYFVRCCWFYTKLAEAWFHFISSRFKWLVSTFFCGIYIFGLNGVDVAFSLICWIFFFTQLPSCICFSEKQYRKRASHDNIFVLQKMRDVILSPQSTLTTLQNTLNHIGHMHQVLTHLISTIQWKHTHTYQEKHKRFFIQDAKPFLLQSFSKHLVNAKWGLINTIILMNALLGRLVLLGKKYYCF